MISGSAISTGAWASGTATCWTSAATVACSTGASRLRSPSRWTRCRPADRPSVVELALEHTDHRTLRVREGGEPSRRYVHRRHDHVEPELAGPRDRVVHALDREVGDPVGRNAG